MKRLALFISLAIMAIACTKTVITPEITCNVDEVTVPVNGTIDEDIFVSFTSNVAWKAAIKENVDWCKVSPAEGEAGEAKLKLIVAETKELDARSATLTITAETAIKEIKIVQGQVDAFELAATEAEVGAEGASIEIKAMTNIDWSVEIPTDCSWIKLAASKAYGEKAIALNVDPYNEYDSSRSATLKIVAAGVEDVTFTINQSGPSTCIWSVDMRQYVDMVKSFTNEVNENVPTNVSMALFNGDVLVCAGDGKYPVIIDKATGEKKGELNTGVKPGYITNDDAGNLVFCSRVWNYWVDYVFFEVFYMTPGSSEAKKLVSCHDDEYYPSYIGAGLSVKGDVTKKAAIAAPWEGVEGVTGDNMVLCWQIENGAKVGTYTKGTITGFVGISWLAGYWMQSPDNFPGFALLSDTLTDGALFACYDENVLYSVDQNFACTALAEEILDSNNTPNALDIRTINGKQYLAVSGGTYFPQWCNPPMRIVDMATKKVIAEPVTHSFNIGDDAVVVGASAAVRMEAAEGGMIVYHINNNCSVIEALMVPLN